MWNGSIILGQYFFCKMVVYYGTKGAPFMVSRGKIGYLVCLSMLIIIKVCSRLMLLITRIRRNNILVFVEPKVVLRLLWFLMMTTMWFSFWRRCCPLTFES